MKAEEYLFNKVWTSMESEVLGTSQENHIHA